MNRSYARLTAAALAIGVAMIQAPCTEALIIHSVDDPPNALATPLDAVIGKWGSNATVVAVSPNHVITTLHQSAPGGGANATIYIDGGTYKVTSITVAPGSADLRVVELETVSGDPANLTHYVDIYEGTDEVTQQFVIGGFGEGRGTDIKDGPAPNADVIGYTWDGAYGTLRWGANVVDSAVNNAAFGAFTNDILKADFDSVADGVDVEATLGDGDSGGGWFILDNGTWKVAALSQRVDNIGDAYFLPSEELSGVRLSSYADFINSTIPEPSSLALLALGGLLVARRRRG